MKNRTRKILIAVAIGAILVLWGFLYSTNSHTQTESAPKAATLETENTQPQPITGRIIVAGRITASIKDPTSTQPR